jgi:hypothetical protein
MFGSILSDMKQIMRSAFDVGFRIFGGLAFVLLAAAAIQYDEVVAPKFSGLSDGIGSVATDMSRRLTSFTL